MIGNISMVVIGYLILGGALFLGQKSMVYFPDNQDFEQCVGFKDFEKATHNGTRFYFKQGSNDGVIVYYHGNAGSACDRSFTAATLEQSNASLIYVEYAGYSNDTVTPSRELILKDVENIHDYVEKKAFSDVFIYGQSIGSGPASYHAFLGNVQHLILVTPFSTLAKVAQSKYIIYPVSMLLTENYDNIQWLQEYTGRLIIFHGDNDTLVPHRFSQQLYDAIPNKSKEYILIEAMGHNDLWGSPIFINKLMSFLTKK